jgi:predicted nuclease of predicted toxin-antitoxin system
MGWEAVRLDADARVHKKKTRFLIDHSLGIEVAIVIRELGWNAKEVSELGKARHSDESIFSLAWKERRMLLTHDQHFWDDRRFPPERNPGVIILPGGSGDETALFTALRLLHSVIAPFGTSFPATKISISSDGVLTTKSRDLSTGAITDRRYRFTRAWILEEWKVE